MMRHAMAKAEADVRLRLWLPRGARSSTSSRCRPTIEDLAVRGVRLDDRTIDFPTGAWGDETRDYHLCIVVPPRATGEEMLAGRVSLIVDERGRGDLAREGGVDGRRGHVQPHQPSRRPLHGAGRAGSGHRRGTGREGAGDERAATIGLGRAAQLAAESGHDGTLRLLSRSSTSTTPRRARSG